MIKTFSKVWEWLDAKKTIIGSTAGVIAGYLPQHTLAHQVLVGVSTVFTFVGVGHKIVKKDYGKLPSGVTKEQMDKMRILIKDSFIKKGDK